MVGSYQVEFVPAAVEDLKKLDKLVAQRVIKKIHWLSENFETVLLYKVVHGVLLKLKCFRAIIFILQERRHFNNPFGCGRRPRCVYQWFNKKDTRSKLRR